MAKRKFKELPAWKRKILIAVGVFEFLLNAAAQIDITRRQPEQVKGSKRRWRLISMINFFGPLAYFRWGRVLPTDGATEA
jgi:hypothetical protein